MAAESAGFRRKPSSPDSNGIRWLRCSPTENMKPHRNTLPTCRHAVESGNQHWKSAGCKLRVYYCHIGIRCRLAGTQWNPAINIGNQPVASSAYITVCCRWLDGIIRIKSCRGRDHKGSPASTARSILLIRRTPKPTKDSGHNWVTTRRSLTALSAQRPVQHQMQLKCDVLYIIIAQLLASPPIAMNYNHTKIALAAAGDSVKASKLLKNTAHQADEQKLIAFLPVNCANLDTALIPPDVMSSPTALVFSSPETPSNLFSYSGLACCSGFNSSTCTMTPFQTTLSWPPPSSFLRADLVHQEVMALQSATAGYRKLITRIWGVLLNLLRTTDQAAVKLGFGALTMTLMCEMKIRNFWQDSREVIEGSGDSASMHDLALLIVDYIDQLRPDASIKELSQDTRYTAFSSNS
ncbi:hypothetical protein R3P38DRAFT_3362498 [Favolaschia claudopus]|uniref:Uncharacterized protein n=1 Tax=Favolaschia claudopus TaxID=2862362 RepID=A0AAW0ALW4_9AGAR